jgi:hypothetical protein
MKHGAEKLLLAVNCGKLYIRVDVPENSLASVLLNDELGHSLREPAGSKVRNDAQANKFLETG